MLLVSTHSLTLLVGGGAVGETMCVLKRGHSNHGCEVASTLRTGDLGKGATSEKGKCLFRADNVWWWCAHYFIIAT